MVIFTLRIYTSGLFFFQGEHKHTIPTEKLGEGKRRAGYRRIEESEP